MRHTEYLQSGRFIGFLSINRRAALLSSFGRLQFRRVNPTIQSCGRVGFVGLGQRGSFLWTSWHEFGTLPHKPSERSEAVF
jgi:hypothetical protein